MPEALVGALYGFGVQHLIIEARATELNGTAEREPWAAAQAVAFLDYAHRTDDRLADQGPAQAAALARVRGRRRQGLPREMDRPRWAQHDAEAVVKAQAPGTLRNIQAALVPEFGDRWIEEGQ